MKVDSLVLGLSLKTFMYDEGHVLEGPSPLTSLGNTSAMISGHYRLYDADFLLR